MIEYEMSMIEYDRIHNLCDRVWYMIKWYIIYVIEYDRVWDEYDRVWYDT